MNQVRHRRPAPCVGAHAPGGVASSGAASASRARGRKLGGASRSGPPASGRGWPGGDFADGVGVCVPFSLSAFLPRAPAHPKAPLPTTRIRSYFSISCLSHISGTPYTQSRRMRGPAPPEPRPNPGATPPAPPANCREQVELLVGPARCLPCSLGLQGCFLGARGRRGR